MVGALSVSVRGQVQAVEPLLGPMSVVLALTNDIAALLALNEVVTAARGEVRRWAWAVLVLAGGTAAGLNTWHAIAAGALPPVWAVVVGIGPVVLAMTLSHLVALVLADPDAPAGAGGAADPIPAQVPVGEQPGIAAGEPSVPAMGTTSWTGRRPAAALAGPDVPADLVVVSARRPATTLAAGEQHGDDATDRTVGTRQNPDSRVARLAARLHAGQQLTGADAAQLLGCSERTGRRLLRQALDQYGTAADTHPSAADAQARGERPAEGVG